ncbi:hypothetical protein BYT27DRAFT_7260750 [Phlegmacium glaucopus]|nr:hypothetical protein BYT27DRAFT_7260750 [Phlegmacium glaucopus]
MLLSIRKILLTGATLSRPGQYYYSRNTPLEGCNKHSIVETLTTLAMASCYMEEVYNLRCRVLSISLRAMTVNTFFDSNRQKKAPHATDTESREVQKSSPILQQAGFPTFEYLEQPNAYPELTCSKPSCYPCVQKLVMERDVATGDFNSEDFHSDESDYGGRA